MGSDTQKRFFELARQAEKARPSGPTDLTVAPLPPDVPEELRLQPSDRDKPQPKKSGLPCMIGALLTVGVSVALVAAVGIGGWFFYTHLTFQKPMDELVADAANQGFRFKVAPDPLLQNLTIDLTEWPDDARKHELIRVLLQYAGKIKTAKLKTVTLSCLGHPRFTVDGAYFRELGEKIGVEHDLKLIRTFPEHVVDMNGVQPYEQIDAENLQDAARQIGNFAKLIDAWTAP